MRTATSRLITLLFSLVITLPIAAQEVDKREGDRQQLLSVLSAVEDALNQQDFEAVKAFVHPDATVTFHDAEVAQGVEGLEAYFNDKLGGSSAVLKSFSTKAQVDAPATFYDDIAIAYGRTADQFVFATGNEFQLESRWTATVRKEQGDWKILAVHFSVNMFDNPLLNTAKDRMLTVALIAFFLGLLLMYLIYRFALKRK